MFSFSVSSFQLLKITHFLILKQNNKTNNFRFFLFVCEINAKQKRANKAVEENNNSQQTNKQMQNRNATKRRRTRSRILEEQRQKQTTSKQKRIKAKQMKQKKQEKETKLK